MPDPLANVAYPYPPGDPTRGYTGGGYPYTSGYAQLSDVQARIASWNPSDPTAVPTQATVLVWLGDATAAIDAALATRGYYAPLQPMPSWPAPSGMPLWNGLGIGAWQMLRSIAAAYAAHFVEAARHGGTGADKDQNAAHWMTIYDDFITRIESGADNLETFGLGGPFAPDIDPAHAAASGSLGFMMSAPSRAEGPMFSKWENLGSGWEGTTSGTPQSGPPFSG